MFSPLPKNSSECCLWCRLIVLQKKHLARLATPCIVTPSLPYHRVTHTQILQCVQLLWTVPNDDA